MCYFRKIVLPIVRFLYYLDGRTCCSVIIQVDADEPYFCDERLSLLSFIDNILNARAYFYKHT